MKINLKRGSIFLLLGAVLCGSVFLLGGWWNAIFAADGSGTNFVNPGTAVESSTGNEFTFTYTASENMDSGEINIAIPSGWSSPNANSGVSGYVTASSSGIIADQKDNLDSLGGWATTNHMTLSSDTADKQVGSASISNNISSFAIANEQWYFNYGAVANWGTSASGNLRVGMFLKPSAAVSSGNLHWRNDDSANLASPNDTIAIGALPAGAWTYTSVTLGGATRNSILSYGFRYTTDIGPATIKADDISIIFQPNDSSTGWVSDPGINDTLITGSGNFVEGTGAMRCTYTASAGTGTSGDCWDQEGSAINIGPGNTVSFWVRPSINLNAGDFAWVDDDSSNIGSADSVISLPALPSGAWTYVTVVSPTSNNMRSFGLRQLVDKGAMTIDIDAIGKVMDTCDSTAGWSVPPGTQSLLADSSILHEGTSSLRNTIDAAASAGEKWFKQLSVAENWSGYTDAGFWVRSSVARSSGQLKFEYASDNSLGTPIASIDIGALPANTWVYQKVSLIGVRSSVLSYGINYAVDSGSLDVWLDDFLIGPGNIRISGSNIAASLLSLSAGQTVSVVYGSGGGDSGVVPPAPGSYAFTTKSRMSDSGTLAEIASSPSVTVTPAPSVTATKLVIVQPSDAQVGNPIMVTIRAENDFNNLDSSFNGIVTLFSTGSATGTGPLNITNGVGSITLNNSAIETVTLFLIDSYGTGLDVSSTKNVSWTATPPPPPPPPIFRPTPTITGRAFPGAKVAITSFTPGGAFESSQSIGTTGGFFDIILKSSGNTTYSVVATDANGDISPAKVFSLDLDIGGTMTNLNIITAPTIRLFRNTLTKGDNLVVSGFAFPNAAVRAYIDGIQSGGTVYPDSSGMYRITVNTAGLGFGAHSVAVNETFADGVQSENSLSRTFTVSQTFTPQADFNLDGIVDIKDWSIFLSRWNAPGGADRSLDMNRDGAVDIADFSIILRAVQR